MGYFVPWIHTVATDIISGGIFLNLLSLSGKSVEGFGVGVLLSCV